MAYPQALFLQRDEELPDPNVDPIGYAAAIARREAKKQLPVGELAPQDLDPLEAAAAPLPMDPGLDAIPVADIQAPDMEPQLGAPIMPLGVKQDAPAHPDRNDHAARAMRIHGPNWGRFVAQAQLGGGRRTPQSIAAESLLNDMNPEWRQLANFYLLTGGPGRATTPMDVRMQQAQLQNQMAMLQARNQGDLNVANVNANARQAELAADREGRADIVEGQRNLALRKMEQEAEEGEKDRMARKEERGDKLAGDLALLERGAALKNPVSDMTRELQGLQKDEMEAKRMQDAISWAETHISGKYAYDRGLRNYLLPWGSSEFTPKERADSLAALRAQFPWLKPEQSQQIIDSIAARKSAT